MPLVTHLDEIKALAATHRDDFIVMQYMLARMEQDIPDAELDALVDAIAAPIIAAIDCTECGNCCRNLHVYMTPDDAQRLADGIDVPLDAVLDTYVDQASAAKEGEWGRFKQQPCAFLRGNMCSVYQHRPESCRNYPQFTPDFRWVLHEMIDGAALCPIVYHTLSAMLAETERLSRNGSHSS